MLANPPTTKNSGMTCPTQVAASNHAWFSAGLETARPPSGAEPTPTNSRCATTTTSTQNTRARSRVRSLPGGLLDAVPEPFSRTGFTRPA